MRIPSRRQVSAMDGIRVVPNRITIRETVRREGVPDDEIEVSSMISASLGKGHWGSNMHWRSAIIVAKAVAGKVLQ